MRFGYLTEYAINGNKYASYIIARNMEMAKSLAAKRGLKEQIVSTRTGIESFILTEYDVNTQNISQMLHAVCFLSFIGRKSGVVSEDEVTGDEGILHEMIHEMNTKQAKKISALKRRIKALIKRVPGVY